jgi:hypothetical protein
MFSRKLNLQTLLQTLLLRERQRERRILIHLCDFGVENFTSRHFEVAVEVAHGVGEQNKSVAKECGCDAVRSFRALRSPPLVPYKTADLFCIGL